MHVRGGETNQAAALAESPDRTPFPSLSISLSEQNGSTFAWVLQIVAICPEGRFPLGIIRTRPPIFFNETKAQQRICNRVVALAYCPGANGWEVRVLSVEQTAFHPSDTPPLPSPSTAEADLFLAAAPCCGALQRPGVQAVDADTVGDSINRVATSTLTIGNVAPVLVYPFNRFRRRLVLTRPFGDAAGILWVATNALAAAAQISSKTLGIGDSWETTYTGPIYALSSNGAPSIATWEESE